jgi:hypothetical protein
LFDKFFLNNQWQEHARYKLIEKNSFTTTKFKKTKKIKTQEGGNNKTMTTPNTQHQRTLEATAIERHLARRREQAK